MLLDDPAAGAVETDFTPGTVKTNAGDTGTPVTVAVMFVVPPATLSTPVASPVVLLMAATAVLLEANVAATGPVVPSLYFAVAVNWSVPSG